MTLEFSRPVSLDRIGAAGLDITVQASAEECLGLANRMKLPAIQSVSCVFHLTRESPDIVFARGHLRAVVTQTCVVSLTDFVAPLDDVFQVRFVPADQVTDDIDPEADDEIPFRGNYLDLGEAAAEQFGLALDPYPRMPDAELPDQPPDEAPHAFAALAGLRRLN